MFFYYYFKNTFLHFLSSFFHQRYANSENRVLYSLYGVVEHSGRLQFGHYTAYVKVRPPNRNLSLYTLGIPRTLNLLNETCDRLRTDKNEERLAKEKSKSAAKKTEDSGDSSSCENADKNLRQNTKRATQ